MADKLRAQQTAKLKYECEFLRSPKFYEQLRVFEACNFIIDSENYEWFDIQDPLI